MFRYRCPHCTKLLQAPEIRAGKTTVCSKCSQPLTIPASKEEWLNERGEPLLTSPTVVIKTPPPLSMTPHDTEPEPQAEPDTDVLGAIFIGAVHPHHSPPTADFDLEVSAPAGMSSALNAMLGESAVTFGPHPTSPPTADETNGQPVEVESGPLPTLVGDGATEPRSGPDATIATDSAPLISGDATSTPLSVPSPTPAWPDPPPHEPETPEPQPDSREGSTPDPVEPAVERPQFPTPLLKIIPRRPRPAEVIPPSPIIPVPQSRSAAPAHLPAPRNGTGDHPVEEPDPVSDSSPKWGSDRGSRGRRLVAATPAPPRRTDDGVGTFAEPVRYRNQMDLAANLTSVLTSRMKPPPRPPRDLRPSTAVWLLTTGIAVALLLATLFTQGSFTDTIVYLGLGQILIGYGWVVWLTVRRNWVRGLICALPPATLWYLSQRKYARYRPLRFVCTGGVILILAGAAAVAMPTTRSWAGVNDSNAVPPPQPDITTQPKLVQLRYYRDQRSYEPLIRLLRALARTDPSYSDEAKNRVELAAELKAMCGHKDSDVKVEAMAAFAAWGGDDARAMCLAATRSTSQEERLMALRLLPRWKDPEVARAIASRIGRPGTESTSAQEGLIEIGGLLAEQAAIPLLRDTNDQGVRLTAVEIVGHEKVCGQDGLAALQDTSQNSIDPGTRYLAGAKAKQVQKRFVKK